MQHKLHGILGILDRIHLCVHLMTLDQRALGNIPLAHRQFTSHVVLDARAGRDLDGSRLDLQRAHAHRNIIITGHVSARASVRIDVADVYADVIGHTAYVGNAFGKIHVQGMPVQKVAVHRIGLIAQGLSVIDLGGTVGRDGNGSFVHGQCPVDIRNGKIAISGAKFITNSQGKGVLRRTGHGLNSRKRDVHVVALGNLSRYKHPFLIRQRRAVVNLLCIQGFDHQLARGHGQRTRAGLQLVMIGHVRTNGVHDLDAYNVFRAARIRQHRVVLGFDFVSLFQLAALDRIFMAFQGLTIKHLFRATRYHDQLRGSCIDHARDDQTHINCQQHDDAKHRTADQYCRGFSVHLGHPFWGNSFCFARREYPRPTGVFNYAALSNLRKYSLHSFIRS